MSRRRSVIVWLVVVTVLVAGGGVFYVSSRVPRGWRDVTREKMLRVVTTYSQPNYYLEQGRPMGFGYEFIKHFTDSLGLSLDITIESSGVERERGVSTGDYDVIMDLVPITSWSARSWLMSEPIAKSQLLLVQLGASNGAGDSVMFVSNVAELEGRDVYIMRNSLYLPVLSNMREEIGIDFDIVEVEDATADMLCSMVIRGDIDCAAVDRIYVGQTVESQSVLDVSTALGFNQFVGWATASEDIRSELDVFIRECRDEQWFLQLKKKYGI